MSKRLTNLVAFMLCAAFLSVGCNGLPSGESANKNLASESEKSVGEDATSVGDNNSKEPAPVTKNPNAIVVGTTGAPFTALLDMAAQTLAGQDIIIEVETFGDSDEINTALAEKRIDAAFFQNAQSLEQYVLYSNAPLMPVGRVIVRPSGVYSTKVKNLDDLADGATIAIPNTDVERARALYALAESGLIKLTGAAASVEDIVGNAKNLKFVEESEDYLPTLMSEVDAVVASMEIMYNAALSKKINIDARLDALYIEDWESIYADVLAIHYDNINNTKITTLYGACTSEAARAYIDEFLTYAAIPAFQL
jgi:D-methionine transport system substrate-binding protein